MLAAAIEACRTATAPHITLPADERVEIEFDPSIEWDAYAQYLGGSPDPRESREPRADTTSPALLHMACHETYAGHHLQHVLIDDALVKGRGWMEFQLTPAFGPHLLISEGAAEVAVDLALPEPVRAAIYRDRLLPLAGLPTADAARLARVETLGASLERAVPQIVERYLDNDTPRGGDGGRAENVRRCCRRPSAFCRSRNGSARPPWCIHSARRRCQSGSRKEATDAERWRRLRDIFTLRPFSIDQEPR